ncbi:MAG TPA: stage II sporulation protein M, partial [Firmicutes bacterium]|nr:stage II sporulation protein M [Bacillota bacterium]HCX70721.1 stage II sporulation protein M [Bacillota bacterium]
QIGDYISNHATYFIVATVMLVMGIVFGALAVKILNPGQRGELWQYLAAFFDKMDSRETIAAPILLRNSLLGHFRTLALITVLGLSVIGSPLILLFLFTRGFVIGFSVGFLVDQIVFKGVLLSIVAVLPQNFLIVPALLLSSVACLDFSIILVRGRLKNRGMDRLHDLMATGGAVLVSGIILILASLIEAYISPAFLSLFGRWLI